MTLGQENLAPGNGANREQQRESKRDMAGPIEILIVAGVFGIIGIYLYVVHRFIKAGEEPPSRRERRETVSERDSSHSRLTAAAL